jgi:hypothetical protein
MRRLIPLLAAVLVVAMAAPAGATPPVEVEFYEETIFIPGTEPPEGQPGPFWVTNDAEIICASGMQEDVSVRAMGFNGWRLNLQVHKRFECDSGTFDLMLQVKFVLPNAKKGPSNTFNWVITGGTGDYENLHGQGKGIGGDIFGPQGPIGVTNTYTGKMHIDP